MEWIAHRGESYDAPENTLASFELAWRRGADAIELDVRLTRDGRLITCHDADAARTSSKKLVIAEHTLADLRRLDVGRWKGGGFAGQVMPTLEEVLATVPAGKRAMVEMKVSESEAVEALVDTVRVVDPQRVAVISFDPELVRTVKQRLPQLRAYWLVGPERDAETGRLVRLPEELIRGANAVGGDGLDACAGDWLDAPFITQAKSAGLQVYAWTVNDSVVARRLIGAGIDGITTDRCAWLRQRVADAARENDLDSRAS
ncbi:MAG: glycerophosphodiester phosphodiesterase [Tepidisphaeraceae bacterium]